MELGDAMQLLSVGTSTFLVGWGLYMVTRHVWPWWVVRDAEQRQRQHEQEIADANANADHANALYENAASRRVFAESMKEVILSLRNHEG